MLVNRYCQVILEKGNATPDEMEGRRFSVNYPEIVERGFSYPCNDNKLPGQKRFKVSLIWGLAIAAVAAGLYFL